MLCFIFLGFNVDLLIFSNVDPKHNNNINAQFATDSSNSHNI